MPISHVPDAFCAGRIERVLLDSMRSNGLDVERALLPDQLDIDESKVQDADAYPVKVRLRHLTDDEASTSSLSSDDET